MRRSPPLTLKILSFLIGIDLLETFAQFCFKKSMAGQAGLEVKSFADALVFVRAAFPSVYLWAGLACVLLIFVVWSTVLSKVDLSVAVPVCSFSYVTVPLVSALFFHEYISMTRWSGIGCILVGVVLVSMSSTRAGKTA